jgi:hypothetical protein
MHYVGLSRVMNIDSLHILNLNEKKIKVSSKVAQELLKTCLPSFDSISNTATVSKCPISSSSYS